MRKEQANIGVDAAALVLFLALSTSGLVLRWALPAGSGRLDPGAAHPERPVSVLWGLDRHGWGEVHYWIAVALAVVLVVHLVLHRKWIAGVLRRKRGPEARPLLGLIGLVVLVTATVAPLVSPTGQVGRESTEGATLAEASSMTGISPADLKQGLQLPPDTPDTTFVAAPQVAEVVKTYYAAESGPGEETPYQKNCAGCHGTTRFTDLTQLPDEQALEALRAARPDGPHQILRRASEDELRSYLEAMRALP